MRLKSMDGPLSSIHNGNSDDILNSPKRINTLQNSNLSTSNFTSDLLTTDNFIYDNGDSINELALKTNDTLNNINSVQDKVQWCNVSVNKRELTNNSNNRLNINNSNLATSLRTTARRGNASPTYSVSSPDDSLLEYEEAHHSGSSAEGSPQDEDRAFDVSDSESSEESNLMGKNLESLQHQRRGIVNPNYPGFQHLAHTLDYKVSSDTDFTDDDFESEPLNTAKSDINNINNNNVVSDHIDSVNRLDSIENIQKVFYDKPVFESDTSGNSNTSDEDTEMCIKVELNIKAEESPDIIGDFGAEVEQEFGRISLENTELKLLENAVVQELEETIDKLHESINAILPAEEKIELNVQSPLNSPSQNEETPLVLEDAKTVRIVQDIDNTKICDAFLSNAKEKIPKIRQVCEKNECKLESVPASGKEEITKDYKEKEDDCGKLKEKIDFSYAKKRKDYNQQFGSLITFPSREFGARTRDVLNRRSVPLARQNKNRTSNELLGSFDVYNIETAMPKIDLDVIESHLRAAREEERRPYKKNDGHHVQVIAKTNVCSLFCGFLWQLDSIYFVKVCGAMFDNFLANFKNQTNNLSDIVKLKTRQILGNINSIKNQIGNTKSKVKSYYTVEPKENDPDSFDDFLSPRAYSMTTYSIDYNSVNENMEWFPYVPPSFDENNIVDRFIKVITLNDDFNRRTDREEIRRRLAMGCEDDYYSDRPGRKPSLQSRLQSGMNLQICFMNETMSDNESPSSDNECPMTNPKQPKTSPKKIEKSPPTRPATLSIGQPSPNPLSQSADSDFFTRQARLQTEARMALAQAKEMARMQMEIERQRQKKSPITEMVRHSLEKVGIPFPEEKRRLSRMILTEMNVAQLQVIVNDLHTQIETLNESLVKFLMKRDDLHMEQDSMLVDIEDLTRFLGAKEQVFKEQNISMQNNENPPPSPAPSSPLSALNSSMKPHLHRIASLVKK